MIIEFDSERVYGDNDKYIRAKIWRESKYKFSKQEIPKGNASYKCSSLIMLDSVISH